MKKFTVEMSEPEFKVIANALQYAKAYKGLEVYESVLRKMVEQLEEGCPKYFVVQGVLDDGICKSSTAVLIRAKTWKAAVASAKAYLETDTGETFTVVEFGEATKDYGLREVLR